MTDASTAQTRSDQAHHFEKLLDVMDGFWSENFDGPSPRDQLRAGLARLNAQRRPRRASRGTASLHESGHFAGIFVEDISRKFVAQEADRFVGIIYAEGPTALRAKIFDRGGGDWRGTTTSLG